MPRNYYQEREVERVCEGSGEEREGHNRFNRNAHAHNALITPMRIGVQGVM